MKYFINYINFTSTTKVIGQIINQFSISVILRNYLNTTFNIGPQSNNYVSHYVDVLEM